MISTSMTQTKVQVFVCFSPAPQTSPNPTVRTEDNIISTSSFKAVADLHVEGQPVSAPADLSVEGAEVSAKSYGDAEEEVMIIVHVD